MQPALALRREVDRVALLGEQPGEHPGELAVVLDEQQPVGASVARSRCLGHGPTLPPVPPGGQRSGQ
ncbi:hypothetical protein LUX39_41490 [Actinomadura madurae]|nr:hypothetical protein [Actinomadura madurae]MCP9970732.1 hypothetical protein [Actinomadura madurae]MCP9983206.1 hypothetical protein [Actinomadura madurae]MCQ0019458.1 hypothetical protein [Actinomadura madurae]